MQQQQRPIRRGNNTKSNSSTINATVSKKPQPAVQTTTGDKPAREFNREHRPRTERPNNGSDTPYVPKPYVAGFINLKRIESLKERGFTHVDLNGRTTENLRDDMQDQPVRFYKKQNEEGTLVTIEEATDLVKKSKSNYVKPTDGEKKVGQRYNRDQQDRRPPKDNFKDPRGEIVREAPKVNPRYHKEPNPSSPFYSALKDYKVKK